MGFPIAKIHEICTKPGELIASSDVGGHKRDHASNVQEVRSLCHGVSRVMHAQKILHDLRSVTRELVAYEDVARSRSRICDYAVTGE